MTKAATATSKTAATIARIKAHPLADRMPMMTAEERAALAADIVANGQRDAIDLYEDRVLDGRNRQDVLIELGIKPRYQTFRGTREQAIAYVISKCMHRNLTDGQKAVAAEAFMDDLALIRGVNGPGRPTEEKRKSARFTGKSSEIAALRFGVSSRNVETVRSIRKAAPAIYGELRAGKLNINQAANRAKQAGREKLILKYNRAAKTTAVKPDITINVGDVLEQMAKMPSGKFRCVFTDPPYNNGYKYHADPTGDKRTPEEMVAWCNAWLRECQRVLTPDGSIFVLIDEHYSDFIGVEMRRIGLHRQSTIVWWETFANHNSAENGLTCRTRFIHYYTKTPTAVFNAAAVREPSLRQTKYNDVRANPAGMVPSNVWQVSRTQGTSAAKVPFADRPPQIPIEIPERCILLASELGDTVFDPFTGNGTTALAACLHGRKYVGCEQSPKYAKQAEQWVTAQLAQVRTS